MSSSAGGGDIAPELKLALDAIKARARRANAVQQVPAAARELQQLMASKLTRSNQRHFYHAIEVVCNAAALSLSAGVAHAVVPLIEYAVLQRIDAFSAGFAQRLREYLASVRLAAAPAMNANYHGAAPPTAVSAASLAGVPPATTFTRTPLLGTGRLATAATHNARLLTQNNAAMALYQQPPPPPPPQQQAVANKSKRSFAMGRYPFKVWADYVLSPVRLNHDDGIGAFTFAFDVPPALFALLQTPPLDGGGIAPHQCRVVLLTDECQNQYSVTVPREGLQIFVNDQALAIVEYSNVDPCERFYGTDVTAALRSGANVLKIAIDKCCCIYRFGVRRVQQFSDAQLVQQVIDRCRADNAEAAFAAARQRLVSSFVSNNDAVLQETAIRASLRDPVTLVRLNIPARGSVCTHAQCFDLASYISFQRSDVRFLCPVCQQRVLFEDLQIDPFFARVLDEIGPSVDDVCIFPDGAVKPLDADANGRGGARRGAAADAPAKRARLSAPDDAAASADADDDDDGGDDNNDDGDDVFFARLKQQIEKPLDVIDLT